MGKKEEYKLYLKSDVWKALRKLALDYADNKCQLCNTPNKLHVHHRKYPKVLGEEPINDLTVLCYQCHSGFHRKFNLRNTNNKAKRKKSRKEIKEEKKTAAPKNKREPKKRSKGEERKLAEMIERRNSDLIRMRY